MSSANPNLAASVHEMTKSGEYCDLCLECDDGSVRVHKVVVCSQVPVIAAECAENKVTGSYSCDNFETSTVRRMIEYIYTGDYRIEDSATEMDTLLAHMCVDSIAIRLKLPALRRLAHQRLRAVIQPSLEHLGIALLVAYGMRTDKSAIQETITALGLQCMEIFFRHVDPGNNFDMLMSVLRLADQRKKELKKVQDMAESTRRGCTAYTISVPPVFQVERNLIVTCSQCRQAEEYPVVAGGKELTVCCKSCKGQVASSSSRAA